MESRDKEYFKRLLAAAGDGASWMFSAREKAIEQLAEALADLESRLDAIEDKLSPCEWEDE